MADDVQRRIIYLQIDASKAVDGSTAATRALASVEKGAHSAGSAMGALEAASVAAGGAAQRTALDLATSATAASNLNTAYRTTAGGALELARATTAAAGSAQAQAAAFARLAEQRAVQASLSQTRSRMDDVARSAENLAHVYGASTIKVKSLAEMQASAVAASYGAMAASAARYAAGVGGTVQSLQVAEAYQRSLRPMPQYGPAPTATPVMPAPRQATGYMGTHGQAGLNAQQKVMLGYQLQDVGVSLIGGMNPLVVAAQQGPQISMLYGGFGNMMRAIPKPLLLGGIGAAAAGAGLYGLNSMAESQDDARERERRFTTLLGSQREAAAAYREIRKEAADMGIAVDVATAAFVSFSRAAQGLGASRTDIQSVATSVEKLTQIAGANDDESNAAGGAVADMLRKSAVGAEDLRKVLASVPQIADQIAAGLGVSVTQLRLMAQEGSLTNRQVMDALVQRTGAVNDEFAKMPRSIGSTFSSLATDLGTVLKGFVDAIPIVNQYRAALDLAARGAKALREASAPETPQSIIARTSAAGAGSAPVGLGSSGLSPGFAAGARVAQRDYYAAQYDVGAQDIQQWATSVRDAARAGDELVVSAAAIAEKFSPLSQQVRASSQNIDAMEKALAALQAGLTTLSGEEAARQIDLLTRSLERAREQATNIDPALKSLNDISRRNEWRANDPSAAGMALQARAYELSGGDPAREQNAMTAALAEQQETVAGIVALKQQEADASTRMLEAVRKGKAATIEAKVEAAVLAFVWANVGKNVEISADQIKAYGDSIRTILKNEDMMGGVNAAKQYTDALAGIAAQMKVVAQGAYAMRRAEAEAMAARADNGTGGLQMQVFDARQALTDATSLQTLREEIDLTNSLAKAAGDVAEQKRLQLEFDIKRAQQNASPSMRGDIARAMGEDRAAKQALSLADGAAAMERQVALTREQIDLVRSGSADYASQLAMLSKKNELIAQGIDVESDANAKRQIAAAGELARANTELERAREAADATKRIWMNAFDNVQSAAGDIFYDIFSGAGFNAQSAAEGMKRIFLRAFAEIAAAAIIRPLIAPIFQAGQSLGIVPAGVGGAAWGGAPTAANSNGISIPGGSSLGFFGNTFSGVGNWLNSPITPTTYSAGYGMAADYASLSGTAMPSGMTSGGMLGNMTWGQGLAGVASMGMGVYSLATSKSTAGMIGGGLGILGGGIGMAGAMGLLPMLGAAAGPIGMGLGLVGSLLPMLFGDSGGNQRTHSSTNANLRYGSGGWYSTGSAYGPGANSSQGEASLRGNTAGIDALFGLMGGIKDPSKVWGLDASSWTAQGKNWSYTSNATHLVDPSGNRTAWRMNTDGMENTGAAQVAILSMLGGAVGELGANARTALEAMRNYAPTMEEVGKNLVFVTDVYDQLGKAVISIKPQFDELTAKFAEMTTTATKLGLGLAPIEAEQKKQTERLGQDFIDNLIDPIAAQLRAWEDEKATILANVDYIREHTDVVVDMARINEALLRKEADLKEQLYGGAVSQLEDAIKRLTYGDLSNVPEAGQLAGMRAAFDATVAQARAGDMTAYQRVANEGLALTDASRRSFASGPEYEAIRREIVAIFSELQVQMTGGPAPTPMASNGNAVVAAGSMADLSQMFAASLAENTELKQQMKTLTAVVERLVAKR